MTNPNYREESATLIRSEDNEKTILTQRNWREKEYNIFHKVP
jgi:hypothetical protein